MHAYIHVCYVSGEQAPDDRSKPLDIGDFLERTAITDQEKYQLLTNHIVPHKNTVFPTVKKHGQSRTFQQSWLKRYPGLVYSAVAQGGMCIYCTLFGQTKYQGLLVTRPYTENYHEASTVLGNHFDGKSGRGDQYHKQAFVASMAFKKVMAGVQIPVHQQVDQALQQRVLANRQKLQSIVKTAILWEAEYPTSRPQG